MPVAQENLNSIVVKDLLHCEFETKYALDGGLIYDFKLLVQSLANLEEFVYVESDDVYYTDEKGDPTRYRFDPKDPQGRAEVTWKFKPKDAKNNIKRPEFNWRVDGTPKHVIEDCLKQKGLKKDFRISKLAHIYKFDDATVPFYTVIDDQDNLQHFVEIEVREDKIHDLTEDQAWDIIVKYEKLLAPLGITAQKRLRRSLYEMYRNRNLK